MKSWIRRFGLLAAMASVVGAVAMAGCSGPPTETPAPDVNAPTPEATTPPATGDEAPPAPSPDDNGDKAPADAPAAP